MFQENKRYQIFRKMNISYPLIRIMYMSISGSFLLLLLSLFESSSFENSSGRLFLKFVFSHAYRVKYVYDIATYPVSIYMFKVNNRNTRTKCEMSSMLTIKTQKRRQWRRSDVFVVNFEHISHLILVFLLLTLNM